MSSEQPAAGTSASASGSGPVAETESETECPNLPKPGVLSIDLPPDEIFRNLSNATSFAVDIGGTLAKIAYASRLKRRTASVSHETTEESDVYQVSEKDEETVRLHFVKFENGYMERCLDFIHNRITEGGQRSQKILKVTGGGAYKFRELIEDKLGVKVDKEEELECIIKGCCFVLRNMPDEVFSYVHRGIPEFAFKTLDGSTIFPFILVQIGSGVSIVKVESPDKFERIGGSSLGGGTFLGIGRMMTGAQNFDELLRLAEAGDHRNVDMLVSDIYGGDYSSAGLPGDLIASSFGKACSSQTSGSSFSKEDMAKSTLITLSNNIGQLACLYAQLHGISRLVFGGFFTRGNPITMHTLTFAVNFWSQAKCQALFLRHEGYLGAIGAFLKGAEAEDADAYCWRENYAGSSGLRQADLQHRGSQFDCLEMDRAVQPLSVCPLLKEPHQYTPDMVDLTQDAAAREYWLDCFLGGIDKYAERAVKSQAGRGDVEARADNFRRRYSAKLNTLRHNPCAYGSLTVRSILDAREQILQEEGFPDVFVKQKQEENQVALTMLPELLKELDALPWKERQVALVKGLLAGNVFDWGAQEVVKVMDRGGMDFTKAKTLIQERPWLQDNLDAWLERLEARPFSCVVVFCDNSGADLVLGVLPFCRQLLSSGSKVILAANARPALNDVTYEELLPVVRRAAGTCDVIGDALASGRLVMMSSGQSSPCLDLRYLDGALCRAMKEEKADLVVVEGMGRAVHTNLGASFSCDVLKAAVLKNRWMASRFGGDMYGVIFRFEQAKTQS